MARAPFQCLIIPFMIEDDVPKFAIFKRADMGIWQFISGGGEDDETPLEAAKRECFEEANIPFNTVFYELDSISTIPAEIYSKEYRKSWGKYCFVIKEHKFAFQLTWVAYDEAIPLLKYDSNRTALTELRARIMERYFVEAR